MATLLLLGHGVLGPSAITRVLAGLADDPLASFVICHPADPDADAPGQPGTPHQHLDCDLCTLCQAPGAIAALPDPAPTAAPPTVASASHSIALPPAQGPPRAPVLAAAFPTGPPILA